MTSSESAGQPQGVGGVSESVSPAARLPSGGAYRFRAFLSYAHRDEAAARALHRALEGYRVPSRLVGQDTCLGPAPRRLGRFFRDRDELSAAGQLSDVLKAALADSQFLIVLVSAAAAASRWVNEEVRQFKMLGRADRILAYIPPHAEGPAEAIFPEALRFDVTADGAISERPAEPIAADARRAGDGVRLARLKLVAALTCLPLDDIVRRDAVRRQRRLGIAAMAASVLAIAMAFLAVEAVRGRAEAERQRAEAEGLIEFMLTDLRAKLEPVGRLEVLDSVGQRALAYYGGQKLDGLSADELGRRARALLLVGEVRDLRGDSAAALAAFAEAERTTAELLARDPANPDRMFDHAQSVFHVGNIAWQRQDWTTVEARLRTYDRLAAAMVRTDPANRRWLREQGHAHTNLGVFYRDTGRLAEAVERFEKAVAIDRRILAEAGSSAAGEDRHALAQSIAWHADGLADSGRFGEAIAAREEEIALHDATLAEDPRHALALDGKGNALAALATLHLHAGPDVGRAAARSAEAMALLRARLDEEPGNQLLREIYVGTANAHVETLILARDLAAAEAASAAALAEARNFPEEGRSTRQTAGIRRARAMEILLLRARGARAEADRRTEAFLAERADGDLAMITAWRALLLALRALDRRALGDRAGALADAGAARALLTDASRPDHAALAGALDRRFPPAAVPRARLATDYPIETLFALAGHPASR